MLLQLWPEIPWLKSWPKIVMFIAYWLGHRKSHFARLFPASHRKSLLGHLGHLIITNYVNQPSARTVYEDCHDWRACTGNRTRGLPLTKRRLRPLDYIYMMKKKCFLPLMSSVEQFCGLWIFFTWKEHVDFEDSRRIIIFWCTEWYLICASSTAFIKLHYWTTKSLYFMHVQRKSSSLILMNEKYSWIGFLWHGRSSSVNGKRPVSFLPGYASCLFVSFLRGAASCLFVPTTQS